MFHMYRVFLTIEDCRVTWLCYEIAQSTWKEHNAAPLTIVSVSLVIKKVIKKRN